MNPPRTKHFPQQVLQKKPATPKSRSGGRDRFAGVNPKLAALLRKHFTKRRHAERIMHAQEALSVIEEVASSFKKLDAETIKWIAEDPDLEYL